MSKFENCTKNFARNNFKIFSASFPPPEMTPYWNSGSLLSGEARVLTKSYRAVSQKTLNLLILSKNILLEGDKK